MSYTIYAAKFEDMEWESGGVVEVQRVAVPILDLDGVENLVLHPEADTLAEEGMNPFIPNTKFTPGAGLVMSGGNVAEMMRRLGFSAGFEALETADLDVLKLRCITALNAGVGDLYMTTRIVQLLNVVEVAIARGADRLVVA